MRSPELSAWLLLFCLLTGRLPALGGEPSVETDREQYLRQRDAWLERDRADRLSADLSLTASEQRADSVLSALKAPWLALPKHRFPPAHRFHEVRPMYDRSVLLTVMDSLPKGGLLHCHPSATGDFDVLMEATYKPEAWIYTGPGSDETVAWSWRWSEEQPGEQWRRMIDLRAEADDTSAFNQWLLETITSGLEDYEKGDIWVDFENNFLRKWRFGGHPALRQRYFVETCLQLAREKILWVEFHTWVGPRRKPDGSLRSNEEEMQWWSDLVDTVRSTGFPHFDIKLVAAASRQSTPKEVHAYWLRLIDFLEHHPDRVIGFDLVSEEDKGRSNLDYLDAFLDIEHRMQEKGLAFVPYIHSGESNRLDNRNLFDAILMGTRRIGHGYALERHPYLVQQVIERNICLEVCPISNQTLDYVDDLRNHPAVMWLATGVPFVLSSDDPGLMRYRWSYDWVAAVLGWDLSIADIRMLIENSFAYGGLTDEQRPAVHAAWQQQWDDFIAWLADAALQPDVIPEEEPVSGAGGYGY
ncbi:hypothetical protein GF324_11825 [bacterium]|nr:hypothetical protein [bacterium]